MLFVRAADLPRLHDPDARSGCAAPNARATARRSKRTSPRCRRRRVTQALIAINVIVFLVETAAGAPLGGGGGGSDLESRRAIRTGAHGHNPYPFYWARTSTGGCVTAGFLHDGLLHILVNMFSLFFVGPVLEPAIGR